LPPEAPHDTTRMAAQIRADVLRMVHRARAAHVGSCLSIADVLAVLYGAALDVRPAEPKWEGRDRFILSKGHAAAALYATLARSGFIDLAELEDYGRDGSRLMAHASHRVPGIELSTGSLGHGLPFGVGKALAAQRSQRPWRTFVLMSDGELDEGSNWEAFLFAAHHRLGSLVAIVDYNKWQSLAPVSATLALEPLADKVRSFGWELQEVDGHDHAQLRQAFAQRRASDARPLLVLAHTIKGKGVSFMEDRIEWHYRSPDAAQLAQALAELGEHDA
jgi:transketolase